MYTDSGKKFIYVTFQSNFKLRFEEIIIFLKFCPRCAPTRVFSRHIFPAHFVGFLFSFFCRFLLISLLLHENEGVHCLCRRALELRHLFLRFSGHSIKEIGKLLKKSEGYISEQVVKSNDFRRQTKEWMAVVF